MALVGDSTIAFGKGTGPRVHTRLREIAERSDMWWEVENMAQKGAILEDLVAQAVKLEEEQQQTEFLFIVWNLNDVMDRKRNVLIPRGEQVSLLDYSLVKELLRLAERACHVVLLLGGSGTLWFQTGPELDESPEGLEMAKQNAGFFDVLPLR